MLNKAGFQAWMTLRRAGLTLTATPDKGIKVSPASALTPGLRALINQTKPQLLACLDDDQAQTLAAQLTRRDQDLDDRRMCLECQHLTGSPDHWRCANWKKAGVAMRAADAGLGVQAVMLQRCGGWGE